MSNAPIVFPPPSANTPFEANNDEQFNRRAQIAIAYEANRAFPGDWWGGEINGDAQVNNAMARLALGGVSKADIHRGPILPPTFPDLGTDLGVPVDNLEVVNDALFRTLVRERVGTSADEFGITRTGEWDTVL
jgi:hypothetical protein